MGKGMRIACCAALGITAALSASAADVTRPGDVAGVLAAKQSNDVALAWTAVTQDVLGTAESAVSYRVYRGTSPDFVPDRAGGSNRVGTTSNVEFVDVGATLNPSSFYYLVTALDGSGNESAAGAAVLSTPTLSASWTDTTIELTWTAAVPAERVSRYRVYRGRAPRSYEAVDEVGDVLGYTLTGLQTDVAWYVSVTAVDDRGNETPFSNEIVEAVAGRLTVRAHDEDYLCWGASKCPPREGAIQRADGWQLMVPVDFPDGEWTRAILEFTMDSRLCSVGQNGTTDKCGGTNPGGYNPCGDPWDRIANVFLVLDDCIESGGSCITSQNLELMRAVTPFGTDAAPPSGSGAVPPRVLTLDVTPFVPLMQGRKYIGVEIGHYVQAGWHVTVDLKLSKRTDEVSPEPPADGIEVVGYGGAPLPSRQVSIPPTATKVLMRVFTSGHGGTSYCDGGSNNGGSCTSNTNCPGGTCQNCDEFCHRTNRLLRDGTPIWTAIPWRDDCDTQGGKTCNTWNACGFPSCLFSRAGWCPGKVACHRDPPCDQDIDLTAALPAGSLSDLSYDVLVQRGFWQVSLVLYWYE